MLPYYHGGYVPNSNQQQQQQQSGLHQEEETYDTYGNPINTTQRQPPEDGSHNNPSSVSNVNFAPMPVAAQDTMNQQGQQQQPDTTYPPYVLMHNQPYSEFTYDSTLMNESAMTPLPETGYVRQQEDVFSELISLANHRQHPLMAQTHLPSSTYTYTTKLPQQQQQQHHHHHQSVSLPTTAGPSLSSPITSSSSTTILGSANTQLPPTAWDHPTQERHYELKVVQQPYRARMCGFGDKDRRPISPPPILQLITRTKDGQVIKPE